MVLATGPLLETFHLRVCILETSHFSFGLVLTEVCLKPGSLGLKIVMGLLWNCKLQHYYSLKMDRLRLSLNHPAESMVSIT
jgi:hypothetical protein